MGAADWAFITFNATHLFAGAGHVGVIVSTGLEVKIILLSVLCLCLCLLTIDQVTPGLLVALVDSLRLSLLELSRVMWHLLHLRHIRLLDTTFFCYEAVLNYLVNILPLSQCGLVIEIEQPHLVVVVL